MKVFISWSGQRSRKTAMLLHGWLPQLINEIEPWMSDIDINSGGDWGDEIRQQLNAAQFGIICVTPGNMKREWLLFEAGALSRQVKDASSRVAPFLIGFNEKSDLRFPLARFQATEPTLEDMRKLLISINSQCAAPRTQAQLEDALEAYWPKFIGPYEAIRDSGPLSTPRRRSERDLILEVLGILRGLDKRSGELSSAGLSSRFPGNSITGRVRGIAAEYGLALMNLDFEATPPIATIEDITSDTDSARGRVRQLHAAIREQVGRDMALKLAE